MATHSSFLACRIPWTEEAGRLRSLGPQNSHSPWVYKSRTRLSNSTTTMYMHTRLKASQQFLVSVSIKWTTLGGWFLRSQVLKSGLESVVVLSFENSSTYWLSEASLHWDQCSFMSLPIFKNILCLYECWHIYKSLWIPKILLWRKCILKKCYKANDKFLNAVWQPLEGRKASYSDLLQVWLEKEKIPCFMCIKVRNQTTLIFNLLFGTWNIFSDETSGSVFFFPNCFPSVYHVRQKQFAIRQWVFQYY